jgi:hypothetical protein
MSSFISYLSDYNFLYKGLSSPELHLFLGI